MAKQLIIGDVHCKKSSLEVVEEVLDKCSKIATKCDVTIFTGDLNDTKSTIRSETIELLLRKFKDWPTPIIVYLGNHDYNNSIECKGHSLLFLKSLDNVTLIEEPTIRPNIDSADLFVPYMPEERFLEYIKSDAVAEYLHKYDAVNLFLHQDMDFAKYSSGKFTGSSIKADLFEGFNRVIVGHIHKAQEFRNIIYVGTPYTESYKEANEAKRVIVLDRETDKILSVPLGVREHILYEYEIREIEDLKEIKKGLKAKIKEGQLVRVRIHAPASIEPKIKRSLFKGLNVDSLKTVSIKEDKKVQVSETMSNEEVMDIYLSQLDLSKDQLESVKDKNKEILGEVNG